MSDSDAETSARGRTPLESACQSLRADVVKVLLEHGASPHYQKGKLNKFTTMLQWSIEAAGQKPTPEKEAVARDIVKLLLDAGADVNERNCHDATALLVASKYGLCTVVQLLLEHGADPHLRDFNGVTAFGVAAQHPEVLALLQPYGPERPSPPKPPQTPEQLIARLIATGECSADEFEPCSEEDIALLEKWFEVQLPEAYRQFLRIMGRGAGRFLLDDHFSAFFDSFEFTYHKRNTQRDMGSNFDPDCYPDIALPPKHFVFAERNGYLYLFFVADGTDDDPPIYTFGDVGGPDRSYESFWNFFEEMVEYYEFYRDPTRFSQRRR